MQYYIDIKETDDSLTLINYLKSLSFINEFNKIEDLDFDIPENIKQEIRKRFSESKDNYEKKKQWNTIKPELYERIQNIHKQ